MIARLTLPLLLTILSKKADFVETFYMNTSPHHISLAEYYFGFLKNLNADSKLDLISKLSQSLKEDETIAEISLQSLFGAYKSDETADEIIAGLRASRAFNRNIETL
jgi:hypothetical protein